MPSKSQLASVEGEGAAFAAKFLGALKRAGIQRSRFKKLFALSVELYGTDVGLGTRTHLLVDVARDCEDAGATLTSRTDSLLLWAASGNHICLDLETMIASVRSELRRAQAEARRAH